MRRAYMLMAGAAALALIGSAQAAELGIVKTIAVPGVALDNYDISFVDQATNRYYLADRSNKSIDVFDGKSEKFVGRVPGFVGVQKDGDLSGPNGVVTTDNGTMAWTGDGDSTIKVIDLKQMKLVDTISTGGKKRADEVAYDPKDGVFIITNDADDPPFATLVSTKPGHKILGKIAFERASDGIEQPAYHAATGMFYMAIPQLDKVDSKGGIAVINPRTAKLEKIVEVSNCRPQGFAEGPNDNAILGCNAGSKGSKIPHQTTIWNMKTEAAVATTDKIGGADEAAYSRKLGLFFTGAREAPERPSVGVIDARTNQWVANIPAAPNPHSIAANDNNGHVYVPSALINGVGCGCIYVLGYK